MEAGNGIEPAIERQPDGSFLVYVPELPGLFTEGSTREEALAMFRDALPGYLASTKAREA